MTRAGRRAGTAQTQRESPEGTVVQPADGVVAADPNSGEAWTERSRIVLTPVAAPSILGLFGFAGATFMVASLLAGWWGGAMAPGLAEATIAPFALFFGGLAQFLAGMWSYRARDGLATAMHGTWGSFWLAYGLIVLLTAGGVLPPSVLESTAFGYWFIVLAVVTIFGAIASLFESLGLFTVLSLLAAAGAAAFYVAVAFMLAETSKGRTILPLGKYKADQNIPGRQATEAIGYPAGMPGSKVGQ
ncbi:MAG: GPR1/FUN34/YaaH family transporter [Pseudonocardia sp.]|nr:GPR1/FUN34/YaaH family transporter [Pseudonocardia sp.]